MALMSKSTLTFAVVRMLALSASIFFVIQPGQVFAQSTTSGRSEELKAGIKLVEEHRDSEAVRILKKATSRNNTDAEAWFYLGLAYVGLLEIKDATKSFETAIGLRPKFADAHLALSDAYLRQSRLEQAATEAERALDLQANNPYAHFTHSLISFRLGSLDDSIKHADLAITQRSDFAEAYLLKAQALINRYSLVSAPDEETRKKYDAQRRSAAEPLRKYVELVSDSENTRVWSDEADLLGNLPSSTKGVVLTGREVTTKARLTSKPEPTYTEQARQYQIEGTVILKVVFASDATVKNIHIVQTLPAGLTEQAVKAARRINFIPATLDGRPVSMWIQLEYNFNLY